MPINSDGTLHLPRPEPVAYDDSEMGDVAVCDAGLTFEDEVDTLRRVYGGDVDGE